jgi:thiamine kinase-like enzyme
VFLKIAETYSDDIPWELIVYRDLGNDSSNLPLVPCFDSCFDRVRRQYHLLLEDVSLSHRAIQPGLPPTVEEAHSVISALAGFHKQWWGSEFTRAQRKKRVTEYSLRRMSGFFRTHCIEVIRRLGNRLTNKDRELLERLTHDVYRLVRNRMADQSNLTLVHGDAHPMNFLLPRNKEGKAIIVDWQMPHWNWPVWCGVGDVAHYLLLSYPPRQRREFEDRMLKDYHEAIAESVKNYSFGDLLFDYRLSVVMCMLTAVHRAFTSDPSQWFPAFENTLAALIDLDCDKLD